MQIDMTAEQMGELMVVIDAVEELKDQTDLKPVIEIDCGQQRVDIELIRKGQSIGKVGAYIGQPSWHVCLRTQLRGLQHALIKIAPSVKRKLSKMHK